MKNQTLISSKDKVKILKCRLLHFLFGALRVKTRPLLGMCLLQIEFLENPTVVKKEGGVHLVVQ